MEGCRFLDINLLDKQKVLFQPCKMFTDRIAAEQIMGALVLTILDCFDHFVLGCECPTDLELLGLEFLPGYGGYIDAPQHCIYEGHDELHEAYSRDNLNLQDIQDCP